MMKHTENINFNYNKADNPKYILFRGIIYQLIKHNESGYIVLNTDNKEHYKIDYALFFMLKEMKEDEAKQKQQQQKNSYNLPNLLYNYNTTDENFKYKATLRKLPAKRAKII